MQEMREMWVWFLFQEDPLEEENGNPLQYSWLKNSTDKISAGYGPWGCEESDATEQLRTERFLREFRCVIEFL